MNIGINALYLIPGGVGGTDPRKGVAEDRSGQRADGRAPRVDEGQHDLMSP